MCERCFANEILCDVNAAELASLLIYVHSPLAGEREGEIVVVLTVRTHQGQKVMLILITSDM